MSRSGWKQSIQKNDFKNAPEDFLLIEEQKHYLSVNVSFFGRKERKQSKRKQNMKSTHKWDLDS